jgi:hypothetical protein
LVTRDTIGFEKGRLTGFVRFVDFDKMLPGFLVMEMLDGDV